MNFYDHSKLKGSHAPLSPSSYRWLNYEPEKLVSVYFSSYATTIGTILHDFACKLILQKMKLNPTDINLMIYVLRENRIPEHVVNSLDLNRMFDTISAYVNDGIGFGMTPEVILFYSEHCYGSADTIYADKKHLRIHDLKTGVSPVHMEQLKIYAALYCLEYKVKPKDLEIELRIYKNCNVDIEIADPNEILDICNKIVESSNTLANIKNGGY